MKRISFVLILCLLLSFSTQILASAEETTISPRINNASDVKCNFDIANDIAIANVKVNGYPNVTTNISVSVKLEKKLLFGLVWNDVEEWTASSTNSSDDFRFTKAVGSGTYRCSFEVTVEGNGGSADVITDQITVKN